MRGMLYEATHAILTKPVKGGRPPDLSQGGETPFSRTEKLLAACGAKGEALQVFGQDRHLSFPKRRPCRTTGLGQVVKNAGGALTETRRPPRLRLDRALSSSNNIRRQPRADPVQKQERRKKGIDYEGPLHFVYHLSVSVTSGSQPDGIECLIQLLAHCIIR